MRRRGLVPGTVRGRTNLLRRWWAAAGDPFAATSEELEEWLDVLELGPRGRYCAISHLHQFYRWAIREHLTAHDPTEMIDRPRLKAGLPRPIHPTDLALALLAGDTKMRAVLLLAAGSGLRCCEIARLRWDDVHDGQARVYGKGSAYRIVPLHPIAAEELDQLERTSVYVIAGWQSGNLSEPGLNVSRRGNDHLHALGISATMHQLRHYAATEALRACRDLSAVQAFLGHASPATTAIYARLDVEVLRPMVHAIPIPAGAA